MKRFVILFTLSILFNIGFAQSNFVNGFIITNENDTVHGLVDFRTNAINSTVCRFKLNNNAPINTYYPGDIFGYKFSEIEKYYITRTVTINEVRKTVFLEYLVQGILNLYYLPDVTDYYLFEKEGEGVIEVTKKPDELLDNKKIKVDNRYKGFLAYIFREYSPLQIMAKKADFNRETMVEMTKIYHDKVCKTECVIFVNEYDKEYVAIKFLPYTGVEVNDFGYAVYPKEYIINSNSFGPIIGFEINLSSPRLLKPLNILLDANLSKLNALGEHISSAQSAIHMYSKYSVSSLKLNFNAGVKYVFISKFNPYVEIAYSHASILNNEVTIAEQYSVNDNIVERERTGYLPKNNFSGLRAGAGLMYPLKNNTNLFLGLLYYTYQLKEVSTHPSVFFYYSTLNTYQIKLGWQF